MLSRKTKFTALAIATAISVMAGGAFPNAQHLRVQVGNFGEGFIVALGGKLYDNLWLIVDAEPPAQRHPSFPKDVDLPAPETWRCVSCHGWDYRGAKGERAKLGGQAAFHSLQHLTGADPAVIIRKIRSSPHNYPDAALPDFALEIMALFISRGQYDRDALLDKSGRATGDLKRGRNIFEGACMNCHQPDGRADLIGEKGDRSSLGWVARNRPEQALHKIRNGVPGADMLAVGFLEQDQIRDLFTYLQSLDPNQN